MRLACAVLIATAVFVPAFARAQTEAERRAGLQAQLAQIETDILRNKTNLAEKQKQRASYERDAAVLGGHIKDAQLSIKARELSLRQIQNKITDKTQGIRTLDEKVADGQASIAQMLRATAAIDDVSLVEVALGGTLSDVMREVDEFGTLQRALGSSFDEIATTRSDLSERKRALEGEQDEEQDLRKLQVLQQGVLKEREKEKKDLATATRGQEAVYLQVIVDKQKSAAQIRAALFGLRDSAAIPFGKAYEYAKAASAGTGVRPALILAILTQETNLGENVGACLVKDIQSGSGIGKNTGRVFSKIMKAPRDTAPFLEITQELGMQWQDTPVSCPQGSGYGGAMGPSQFIPSTWVLYKDQLERLTGGGFPDPWNARTAIFATALLMQDNGATGGEWATERKAALRYFAGGNWSKPANAFYGDNVMDLVARIQRDIDTLEK